MKQALVLVVMLAGSSLSQAGVIYLSNLNDGVPGAISGLTGLATTGDLMAGMEVTGRFSNGMTQACLWAATGSGSGGCTAGNATDGSFSLNQSGDTLTSPFSLVNLSSQALLLVLTMNALPGSAVFDMVATPGLTPGSDAGQAVSGTTSSVGPPNGAGTYSNLVNVGANLALGDLYSQLSIDFALGLAPTTAASFLADTDLIMVAGPGPGDVPEPVTFLLCGITLLAMGILRRLPDEML